ncbi:MAG: ATP-binding protein [Myxococcota bacterium]
MVASSYGTIRDLRVRTVGTRFLQLRPWIAAVGALLNGALLTASGAPMHQRLFVGGAMAILVASFAVEAIVLRRRPLTEAWLRTTLIATALAIGLGCTLSGGARSPLLPLVFAPVVIAFAAFARESLWVVVASAVVVLLVAFDPFGTLPAVAAPYDRWMSLVSVAVALVLMHVGVTGLADAYQRAGESTGRLRRALLDDAASRAREAESMGARVAHEVLNPLASIKGLVQLLASAPQREKDQRRLDVVQEEVDRVATILQDYLRFARPLTDLELREADLRAIVDDVASLLETEAAERGVSLEVAGEALSAIVDPRRIREALLNLSRNSLAAMPNGGPLTLRVHDREAFATIEVKDGGEGMSAETLARIGTPYFTTRDEGTGLGVTLAQSVLRQHGGELIVESEVGVGTSATLRLPKEGPS